MNEPSKKERSSKKDELSALSEGGAAMVEIMNKLQQPLMLTVAQDKSVYLGPRETTMLTEEDLASPVMQKLISERKIVVFGR